MTPKENTLETLRFGHPERVPGGLEPGTWLAYFGANHESFDGGGHHLPIGSQWTDIWGTVWHREHEGVMGFPRGNPIPDITKDLRSFRWPDPDDDRLVRQVYEAAAKIENKESVFVAGSHRQTLWEKSYMLCGMENMMCNFLAEPEATRELLHRIMDFQIGIAKHYLAVGIDAAHLSDDLGTQRGLLLSPEIVQEFLVPEYRRLFDLYKERGVIINFHSCGHIMPLLETFMDLGVDILNPIQTTANDLDEVRRITHGRMSLAGAVSSHTIVAGPPERIREEVAKRLWQLGRNGGYLCMPDQGMPWPEEHYQAFKDALADLGTYPLREPANTRSGEI